VLEALQGEAGRWRPDWPPEIPPDAFAVKGAAGVELDAGDGEALLKQYRLTLDARGRPTEFPLALTASGPEGGSVFAQVRLRYGAEGGVTRIDIEIPAPPPPDEDAPETPVGNAPETAPAADSPGASDSPVFVSIRFDAPYFPRARTPPAARVEYGEKLYHVLFSAGTGEIAETWFDPRGIFSAYFKSRIGPVNGGDPGARADSPWRILGLEGAEYGREDSGAWRSFNPFHGAFYYESGGNLSESSGGYGSFSAIYGQAGLPLYWSRDSRNFSFQWDQEGRLVRRRDLGADASPADFRCDYEFDSRGNWIYRRETALVRAGSLLVPAYSRDLVRRVVYAEGEGDGGLD
jgi:YD repeat-containing protein